jgi:NitT/TauT family transport system substrate-binding protein
MAGCRQAEPATIRMALLPILDTLPIAVANEQGYFADEGLTVELLPVTSAAERDQLIQAGQADGMINELLSTMLYNKDQPTVTVVSYSRTAMPDFPQYRILGSGAAGITSLEQLKGQDIGISQGTIIEYVTERLLEAEGYNPGDFNIVAVPGIADRMSLLGSGELAGATLPDPLALLAVQGGANVLVDDSSHTELGHSAISFRNEFLEENPNAVSRFLKALEEAVNDINADKDQFSNLLIEQNLVPEPLIGSYALPDFPTSGVPTQAQWDDILAWAQEKGYVTGELEYGDSVDDSFLP